MMKIPSVLKLIVAVLFLSILPAPVHSLTPEQVFDKVKDSVVVVKTLDAQGKMKSFGSGVLISAGRVATNCHVVEGGASYQVGRGQQIVAAILYAEDGDKDICILDAKGIGGEPAQLGKAAGLKVGVPVYAVGAPQGLELSISDGIVAQLRGGPPPLIQTTAAISPGSSGGGLFDGEGRLVGLTTLYMKGGQSLNFATPVEWIDEVKPGLRQPSEVRIRKEVSGQNKWSDEAFLLHLSRDWHGLLDLCRKWIKSEPQNADAWEDLGHAYNGLKRYSDAIEAYRQAILLNPEAAHFWRNIGTAYGNLKRYDEEVEAYRQALRIGKKDNDAWIIGVWKSLGQAYHNLKRYDDEIDAYRQVLLIRPGDISIWNDLGSAYYDQKRYDDAIAAYRQGIRIFPDDAILWSNIGLAYLFSGNRTAALEAVKELRRLDPARADKLFNLIVPR